MKKGNSPVKGNQELAKVHEQLANIQNNVIGLMGEAADTYIGFRNYAKGNFYFTDVHGKEKVLAGKGKPGDHIIIDSKTWNMLKEQRPSIGYGHQGRDDSILTGSTKRAPVDKDISFNAISDEEIKDLASLHIDEAMARFLRIDNLDVMRRVYSLLDQMDKRPVELLDEIEKRVNIVKFSLPKNFYHMNMGELKSLAEDKGMTSFPGKVNTTHEMRDVILEFMEDVS